MRWEFREVGILKSKHLSKNNSSTSCWSWQIFGPLLLSPNMLKRWVCLTVDDVSFILFIIFRIAIPHVNPLSSLSSQSYLSSIEQPISQVLATKRTPTVSKHDGVLKSYDDLNDDNGYWCPALLKNMALFCETQSAFLGTSFAEHFLGLQADVGYRSQRPRRP